MMLKPLRRDGLSRARNILLLVMQVYFRAQVTVRRLVQLRETSTHLYMLHSPSSALGCMMLKPLQRDGISRLLLVRVIVYRVNLLIPQTTVNFPQVFRALWVVH
jgi:hypothetical protein